MNKELKEITAFSNSKGQDGADENKTTKLILIMKAFIIQ
jgi:hypothetical protein